MMHKATYTVKNYPASNETASITYHCACGKTGRIEDGPRGATMRRARQAHSRHVAKGK